MSLLYQRVSARSLVGRAIRLPLRVIPPDAALPIISGSNRGLRWRVGSGPHSCWLGFFESAAVHAFCRVIRDGDIVFDIGANAGFFTLAASRRVGAHGRVLAFEPQPDARRQLQHHTVLNKLSNVVIRNEAVAERSGRLRFSKGASFTQGGLSESGELSVDVVSIDDLSANESLQPAVIKIDVEGAELRVLQGCVRTLSSARPFILIETHSVELCRECAALLRSNGYRLEPVIPWSGFEALSGTFLALPD